MPVMRGYALAALPILLGCAVALSNPASAQAQSGFPRTRNVGVGERPLEGYEAAGIVVGTFTAYPKITLRSDYDDNILASDVDPISDVVFGMTPEIDVKSNWNRHEIALSANSTITRHDKLKDEDATQWSVEAKGRADLSTSATVNVDLAHNRLVEPRTSAAYLSTDLEPIRYDISTGSIAGSIDFTRVRLSSSVQFARYTYHDALLRTGGVISQDFRDYNDTSAVLRADYALSPSIALFSEGSVGKSHYRSQSSTSDRDSSRSSVLAGVDMELTNLISGELSVGYLDQEFDDPELSGFSGVHYRAKLRWFPTQLVTVSLSGTQTTSDSGLVGDAGLVTRDLNLQADYELRRNLIVTARVGYVDGDYEGIDREDKRTEESVALNYIMNRAVGLSLRYSHLHQTSSGADRGVSFTSNRIGVALVLQR